MQLNIDSIDTLDGATASQQFIISYDELIAVSGIDNSIFENIAFKINSIESGTLKKGGTSVTDGVDQLEEQEVVVWTPSSSATSTTTAFIVEILNDGNSVATLPVQIDVSSSDGLDVDAKYSADVVDTLAEIKSAAGSTDSSTGTLSGLVDAYIDINSAIDTYYSYYDDVSYSNSSFFPVTLSYSDGSTATYRGTLNNLSSFLSGQLSVTTADISEFVFNSPGAAKVTAKGDLNYRVYSSGSYSLTSANFSELVVSFLDPYLVPSIGKFSSSIEGDIYLSSADTLNGTINQFSGNFDKFVKSSIIKGEFVISGSLSSGSSIEGNLTNISEEYVDGSYLTILTGTADHFIESNDELDGWYFTSPDNLPHSDNINFDLPVLSDVFTIASGTGNDVISLKGGGGKLHINAGLGNDIITTIDGDHEITGGSGNDIITGGSGNDTVIYSNAASAYQTVWSPSSQTLTVFSDLGEVDLLSGVELLRFSDGDIDASSLMNVAPTLSSVDQLAGAYEDSEYTISWGDLINAADEEDYEDDAIRFLVESVNSGTLKKNGSSVIAGSTAIVEGDSLSWTPASNQYGVINAFSIRAIDELRTSLDQVDVSISVVNVNDPATGSVTVSGLVKQNEVLTAEASITDIDQIPDDGMAGSMQLRWLADGVVIEGAASNTFTITQSEVGKEITAEVYYTDLQGTAESVLSSATAAVENVNDLPTARDKTISAKTLDPIELSIARFGYTDLDGDNLSSVKITSVPADGALEFYNGSQWSSVIANDVISGEDISLGNLRLSPYMQNNKVHSSFSFKVSDGTAYSDNTFELSVAEGYQISCNVRHWKSQSVKLQNVALSIGDASELSSLDGSLVLEGVIDEYGDDDGQMTISPSLTSSTNEIESAITLSDVLVALKIYLGKSISEAISSPYNYVASDFNANGATDLGDVLGILKYYLGKSTQEQPEWVFIDADANHDFSKDSTSFSPIERDFSVDDSIELVGVLTGDVDGSWGAA